MHSVIEMFLIVVGLILAVPVVTIVLQVLAALPRRPASKVPQGPRPRLAVLVPAHNEQLVIGKTLNSILRQLEVSDRLVVIADNCLDHTAETARQLGAEVTIRADPASRGKGYALEHGLKFLEKTHIPDVVIFVDADCELGDGCIDRVARLCLQTMRPIQATYLMNPPQPPQRMVSMVSFAWKVNDFVRPLGWHRLGFPCRLAGSGMAFPWEVVRSTNLAGESFGGRREAGSRSRPYRKISVVLSRGGGDKQRHSGRRAQSFATSALGARQPLTSWYAICRSS